MLWGKTISDTVKSIFCPREISISGPYGSVLSSCERLGPLWFSLGFMGVLKGSSKTKYVKIGSGFTNHNGRGNLI